MRRIRIPYEYGRLVPEQMKNGIKGMVTRDELNKNLLPAN